MLINNATELSQSSASFTELDGLYQNPYMAKLTNLAPGNYTLMFRLDEANGNGTDTAAGIDNVSVTGTAYYTANHFAAVTAPEPSTFLLLGAGLLGVGLAMKRMKG